MSDVNNGMTSLNIGIVWYQLRSDNTIGRRTLSVEQVEFCIGLSSAVAIGHVTQVGSGKLNSTLVDLAESDHQWTVASDEHDSVISNQLALVVPQAS